MQDFTTKCVAILALSAWLPGFAAAQSSNQCKAEMLKGQYVFTASGFTRAPSSGPGIPWVPKAILEIIGIRIAPGLNCVAVRIISVARQPIIRIKR